MKVLFDLRPQSVVASQNTRVRPVRVIMVALAAVLILVSAFNIVMLFFELDAVKNDLERIMTEERSLTESQVRLAQLIEAMRKKRDDVRSLLEFRSTDLPAVEFLASLEGIVPPGLKIHTIEMRSGAVTMRGSSLDDRSIIDFGADLGSLRGVVSHVSAPITVHSSIGSRMISDFTLSCTILPLSGVADQMKARQGAGRRDPK